MTDRKQQKTETEFDHQNVFCAHWYILEVGAPYVVMHNGSHMTLAPFKKVAAEGGDPSEYCNNLLPIDFASVPTATDLKKR